jgi:thioredoxin 1
MNHKKQTPWMLIGLATAAVCLASLYVLRSSKPSLMDRMQQPATGIDTSCDHATPGQDDQESASSIASEEKTKTVVLELTDPCCIDYIKECTEPSVIKFYANWCGACNHLATYYEEVAKEFEGTVTFYSLDSDNQELMKKAQEAGLSKEPIQYLPTMVFFEKGKVHEQQTGAMPKEELIMKVKTTFNV